MTAELVLGTAQLGDGYGLTNRVGRLDDDAVRSLLSAAADAGITAFDTAGAYGDAMDRLARHAAGPNPRYIAKAVLDGAPTADAIFGEPMRRLGVARLDGLLLHRVHDLGSPHLPAALGLLRDARDAGVVRSFGVSVYDHDDLLRTADAIPDLDLIQIPGSVVDRRLLDDPEMAALAERGVRVQVRSVFLQGLLLVAREALPSWAAGLADALDALDAAAAERGATRMQLLLGGVRAPWVDGVVVGATSAGELTEISSAWDAATVLEAPSPVVPVVPADLLDPRRWPAAG